VPIEMIHAPGVEEDQRDKDVDRSLLREPEAELEAADANGIELLDQQDAESVRANEPDDHAAQYEPQVSLPVGLAVFRCHPLPQD